jgi:dipeptidyl aminopeptidase/acylaminoacyl peptidase
VRDPGGSALTSWLDRLQRWHASRQGPQAMTVAYGDHPDQVADVWRPDDVADPPVVVSLHGGYFRASFRRDLHDPICRELARRGFAVWNVEYRRTGTGGGLEETTADVLAAVDALPGSRPVAAFGHSAGGFLAEWLAAHPRVELAVPLAGVLDPAGVVRAGWDRGGVSDWLGTTPDEAPERYAAADPRSRLPAGARHVLIHGTADETVGVQQSRAFAAAARAAGDPVELVELEDEGHFAFLDPREPAFEVLYRALDDWRSGLR